MGFNGNHRLCDSAQGRAIAWLARMPALAVTVDFVVDGRFFAKTDMSGKTAASFREKSAPFIKDGTNMDTLFR